MVIYLSGNQIPLKFVGHIKGGQMRPLMDRAAADNAQKNTALLFPHQDAVL